MSIQTLRVSIRQKGKGETASFERGYNMKQDFDRLPTEDGHSHAKEVLGLTSDYIVVVQPVLDAELEAAILDYTKEDSRKILSTVINPLQSSFVHYNLIPLCGKLIAVSGPFSSYFRYGVVDPAWVEEAVDSSSITIPEAA